MGKAFMYYVGIFVVLAIAAYVLLGGVTASQKVGGTQGNAFASDAQEVVIGMRNYNYYPNTVTVEAGKPVAIRLDSSVVGCFRDFTIRELGVREYLQTPDDVVVFTPTKPGRYTFSCSMGMGTGTLIVE